MKAEMTYVITNAMGKPVDRDWDETGVWDWCCKRGWERESEPVGYHGWVGLGRVDGECWPTFVFPIM